MLTASDLLEAQIIPLRPATLPERVLFHACQPPGDRRVAELLDEQVERGTLTATHLYVVLIHGSAGKRPRPGTDAGRIWAGAIATLAPLFAEVGLTA
jgi:hypothetical protein